MGERKIRRQSAVKGGRRRLSPSVVKEIEQEIAHCAKHYHVSKSWVQAVALGEAFGIDVESYIERRPQLRRVK